MVALLLGLIRPTWVLPSRRATRVQVFLLYSAAGALVLLLASGTPQRSAHAQITNLPADSSVGLAPGSPAEATPAASGARPLATTSAGSGDHEAGLGEQEPAPESLRDLASVKHVAVPGALLQMTLATGLGWVVARELWGWSNGAALVLGLGLGGWQLQARQAAAEKKK